MGLKEDLLNVTLDLDDVLKKYDLNLKHILEDMNYDDYLMILENPITDQNENTHNYIFKNPNNKFVVQKAIDGKTCYFGSYKTLSHAVKVRNRLKEEGWDLSKLHDIQRSILGYVSHVPRVCYTLWDSSRVQFNGTLNPEKCNAFKLKFNKCYVPLGCFVDFVSVEIISGLVDEFIS